MEKLYNVTILGVEMSLYEFPNSLTIPHVEKELNDDVYGINNINFNENDVIIDLGGHVGMFTIYLSKKYPNIKIYTFEANPLNFNFLKKNIEINNVKNVHIFNKGVFSKTGEKIKICAQTNGNSGGSSIFRPDNWDGSWVDVDTISLSDILKENNITNCKFLKIDVEGAEFDTFYNFYEFEKIKNIGIEFHENDILTNKGYVPNSLYDFLVEKIGGTKVFTANNWDNGIIRAKNF